MQELINKIMNIKNRNTKWKLILSDYEVNEIKKIIPFF
jgi:hypothetical protein